MKKIILLAGLAFFSINAFSQATMTAPKQMAAGTASKVMKPLPPASERAVQYSQELKGKLNLTPDQYTKVLAVNTECIKRKDAAKASGRDASKDISTYRQSQYQSILKPDQLAKLKAMNAAGSKH